MSQVSVQSNWDGYDYGSDSWESRVDLVLPKLSGYLGLNDLLKCRLVSKKWLAHLDNLFAEGNPLLRPYNQEMYTSTLHHRLESTILHQNCHFGKIKARYLFRRSNLLTGFTRRMVSQLKSNKNPFIGRFVSVGLHSENREQDPKIIFGNVAEYWINVEKFLRNWGHNIWYLQLTDDGLSHTAAEFYILLIKLLKSLPNLRLLDIPTLRLDTKRKLSEPLDLTIINNPLPLLPLLESILLPHTGSIPQKIQHAMVKTYSRQLRNLRYALSSSTADYPHVITKLNELTIFKAESSEKLSEVLDLFTIPLAKLTLDLTQTPKIRSWSVKHVLSLLQDFPVKVAILRFGNTAPLEDTQVKKAIPIREQFKVETLQTLEMNHCVGTSYNFLWCLPALKHFHVDFNPFVDGDVKGNLVKLLVGTGSGTVVKEEDQQEVDIRELMEDGGDLYQSNVWEVAPALEVMSFTKLHWCWWPKRTVYKRDVYEWHKKVARLPSGMVSEENNNNLRMKIKRRSIEIKEVKLIRPHSRMTKWNDWTDSEDVLNGNEVSKIKYPPSQEENAGSIDTSSSSLRGINMRRLHACDSLTKIKLMRSSVYLNRG